MLTPEAQSIIANIRAKHAAGTAEAKDYHQFIRLLREGRTAASAASAVARGRKVKEPVNVDKLFSDLDAL